MTTSSDEVRRYGDGNKGVFFVQRGERRIAELSYSLNGKTVVVDHTRVDPEFRGGTLATDLVEALAQWARREEKRVVPMCSYVRSVFAKDPRYADLRPKDEDDE